MKGFKNILEFICLWPNRVYTCDLLLALFFFGVCNTSRSQIIFSEPFNEANTSTTGSDNIGGVNWTTSCATCLAGDYFYVNSNTLECEDTNGPATWTTGNINTAACTSGLVLSIDFNLAATTNALEECTAGCGCNCVDWISVEYNANGTGFIPLTSPEGGACAQTCSGGTYVILGALSSGTSYNFSTCLPAASTLVLRISLQTWAAGEKYQIDNVTVSCSSCALPIELINFNAKSVGSSVELNWATSTETNNNYFTIERSASGTYFEPLEIVNGAGNSKVIRNYKAYDTKPLDEEVSYYRLKQTDLDGSYTYSKMVAVAKGESLKGDLKIWPNPSESGIYTLSSAMEMSVKGTVQILDNTGRIISETALQPDNSTIDLSHYPKGLYIVRINSGDKIINRKIIYN